MSQQKTVEFDVQDNTFVEEIKDLLVEDEELAEDY